MDKVEKKENSEDLKNFKKPKEVLKRQFFLSRLRRKILGKAWLVRALVLGSIFFLVVAGIYFLLQVVKKSPAGEYLGLARDFISASNSKVKVSANRTNILILGKGGEGHDAPDLTDTVIFVSVSNKEPQLVLISLPRDIWIPALRAKLNSVYYWGNQLQTSRGMDLAKATVEEIVDLPVHYGVVIDFSGLKKIVDDLGGIRVNVKNPFVDEKYPIAGRERDLCGGDPEYACRYERIEFLSGVQDMDGIRVLQFVRSRNSIGVEGTDFARATRQQLVVEAIKDRIFSREILLSPKKLLSLKETVLAFVETDIPASSGAVILRRVVDGRGEIEHYVLPQDLLENPPISSRYDNLYVFIPKKVDDSDAGRRSWEEVGIWVACALNSDTCKTSN